jgi:hypothetical protein
LAPPTPAERRLRQWFFKKINPSEEKKIARCVRRYIVPACVRRSPQPLGGGFEGRLSAAKTVSDALVLG